MDVLAEGACLAAELACGARHGGHHLDVWVHAIRAAMARNFRCGETAWAGEAAASDRTAGILDGQLLRSCSLQQDLGLEVPVESHCPLALGEEAGAVDGRLRPALQHLDLLLILLLLAL